MANCGLIFCRDKPGDAGVAGALPEAAPAADGRSAESGAAGHAAARAGGAQEHAGLRTPPDPIGAGPTELVSS